VWGPAQVGDTRSLRVCIRNLRAKLEAEPTRPRYIVTEAGVGYRLRLDEDN
jgi:two-component system KDP operon response regulator KdpE